MKAQRKPNPPGDCCGSKAAHRNLQMLLIGREYDGVHYINCVRCGGHWQFDLETLEIWHSFTRKQNSLAKKQNS